MRLYWHPIEFNLSLCLSNHCCITEISVLGILQYQIHSFTAYMMYERYKVYKYMSRPLAHISSFVINFSVSKFFDDKDISDDTD